MLSQTLPPSATEYARGQAAQSAAVLAKVRRLWRRMGTDFDTSWGAIVLPLTAETSAAQHTMAAAAFQFIPDVLEDTGQVRAVQAVAVADPLSLVGVAGDGRPVDSLLYGAVTHTKTLVAEGASVTRALTSGAKWLTMATGTLLSDTARQAESVGIGIRPVSGYVRMLQTPSCSRCVVLAGQWYRSGTAFRRHPRCDCRHIPASEAVGGDMTINSRAYFDGLTTEQQDATFTAAGAEAIRAGADINQVVNARRGMNTAQTASGRRRLAPLQVGGRDAFLTTEGTTRRGLAYQLGSTRRPRLMPESIAQIANGKDDYLRLLRVNGYIF